MLNKGQRRKKIIIADSNQAIIIQIEAILRSMGFNNISFAAEYGEIYRILRPYHDRPENLGLVIVDEQLPGGEINEMSRLLSLEQNGGALPFIILRSREAEAFETSGDSSDLICELAKPVDTAALKLSVELLILLKDERFLRHKQEEKLLSELATRKLLDAKLKYLVGHDELTGLMNRNNLNQHVFLSLTRNKKLQQNGALLLIDLDRFGLINDLEGFDVADQIIVSVVTLIRQTLQQNAWFARIAADEFCLYFEHITEDNARIIAETIRQQLNDYRFNTGTVCYTITASIGIATLQSFKIIQRPEELLSRAHQACYMAKQNGRNMVWLYNENDTMIKERQRDVFWVPVIRDALLEQRFFLLFQPVVSLISGKVSHYEVLIRMRDCDHKVISPGEFIPAAERMGLIHSIDLWVMENAIDFLALLPPESADVSLSINLSGTAFQDDALLPALKRKLELSWVNAKRITFEITETAAIDNFEQTRQMIQQIRTLGCRFALDDFGAGFCSFNYLKKFPVDYVKIDGQFIQNLTNDDTDQVLVKSMNEIAHQLGKKTIAEFIESPAVLNILIALGIDYGQGYIFGRPSLQLLEKGSVPLPQILLSHQEQQHGIKGY
ncbi:MAG: GGDEF-domain containing protein [Gammaproteobacteria bacterium HGW-Gammaproteobacteria-3]|nr:MAG: GGDEF-domain containing protein [Gammaproteobacteria bacterium HGW-Gammaproteobacteria-3]